MALVLQSSHLRSLLLLLSRARSWQVVRREPQSYAADWWSLGVTLAYCATGLHPFRTWPTQQKDAPPPPPPSAPPAQGRPRLSDDELNYNTQFLPIAPRDWGVDEAPMSSLISQLLDRNASTRLGATGSTAVRAHAAFEGVEWELLREAALPAPYLPDPNLVYAKDRVPALSEDDRPVETGQIQHAATHDGRGTVDGSPMADAPRDGNGGVPTSRPPLFAAVSLPAPPVPRTSVAVETSAVEAPSEEFLERWEYVSGAPVYAEELRELVRKLPEDHTFWSST